MAPIRPIPEAQAPLGVIHGGTRIRRRMIKAALRRLLTRPVTPDSMKSDAAEKALDPRLPPSVFNLGVPFSHQDYPRGNCCGD